VTEQCKFLDKYPMICSGVIPLVNAWRILSSLMEQISIFGKITLRSANKPNNGTHEMADVVEGTINVNLKVVFDNNVRLEGSE